MLNNVVDGNKKRHCPGTCGQVAFTGAGHVWKDGKVIFLETSACIYFQKRNSAELVFYKIPEDSFPKKYSVTWRKFKAVDMQFKEFEVYDFYLDFINIGSLKRNKLELHLNRDGFELFFEGEIMDN